MVSHRQNHRPRPPPQQQQQRRNNQRNHRLNPQNQQTLRTRNNSYRRDNSSKIHRFPVNNHKPGSSNQGQSHKARKLQLAQLKRRKDTQCPEKKLVIAKIDAVGAEKKLIIANIDAVAQSAIRETSASREPVFFWKVSRLTLRKLGFDSWAPLGFSINDIPSLNRLAVSERKNAGDSIKAFATIWKDACHEYSAIEVFRRMLEHYPMNQGKRSAVLNNFSTHPLVGFVNVLVICVKLGMWETFCNTFHFSDEAEQNVKDSIGTFVAACNDVCEEQASEEVLGKVLDFYGIDSKGRNYVEKMFSTYPLVGCLNIVVASIRSGMWDSLCGTSKCEGELQQLSTQANEFVRPGGTDVEPVPTDRNVTNNAESKSVPRKQNPVYSRRPDFFLAGCSANETPSCRHYLQSLQQLSADASPLDAAYAVFQILLRWSDSLKCGALQAIDITYVKECLSLLEVTVLPTTEDRWVSLHPFFGLVCWGDDFNLQKEFGHEDKIVFLCFGELTDNEKEILNMEVCVLLRTLGIPSLSEIVSREAMYCSLTYPEIPSSKTSMVNGVLPLAQRYLYNLYPSKYSQLKQLDFSDLQYLRIVIVEKLFYRNVIQGCGCASNKLTECTSLLQGNILYTRMDSDPHSMFMELSRLFFEGRQNLHLANFLHIITVMAESGSSEEQIELFIRNSQKMAKLPKEESIWSLSQFPSPENNKMPSDSDSPLNINDQSSCRSKINPAPSSWPSVSQESVSEFGHTLEEDIGTHAVITRQCCYIDTGGVCEDMMGSHVRVAFTEIKDDVEDDGIIELFFFPPSNQIDHLLDLSQSSMGTPVQPANYLRPEKGQSRSPAKNPLFSSKALGQQTNLTGRQGELVAFKYFLEKARGAIVNWVNQEKETGLPYDIVVTRDKSTEYIEVKASRYARKDWFGISATEWQFATEKGDSFSIAQVILSSDNLVRVVVYKNPVKLSRMGKLQLGVATPRCYRDHFY